MSRGVDSAHTHTPTHPPTPSSTYTAHSKSPPFLTEILYIFSRVSVLWYTSRSATGGSSHSQFAEVGYILNIEVFQNNN